MVRRDDKKIFYPEADAALLSKVEYTGLILRPYRFGASAGNSRLMSR